MEKRINDFLPDIKDYYTITSEGKISSDNSGLMKTRNKAGSEYQIINLVTTTGNKKAFRVHRLVAMAFIPCDNMDSLQVNHLDGDKKNNKLENLQWCTASENQLHAYKMGLKLPRRGEKSNFHKLKTEDIKKIYELRKKGLSQEEIGNIVGCTKSNISCILKGKTWQAESSTTIPSGSTSKQREMGNTLIKGKDIV